MIRRTTGTGDVIAIVYDGTVNRVAKNVNGVSTYFHVDENNHTGYAQVYEELIDNGGVLEVQRVYLYGLDLINQTQLLDDGQGGLAWFSHWHLYDSLGTVRGLADTNGDLSDYYTYEAFGNLIDGLGITANSYFFTREQLDLDLSQYFLRARYLSQSFGRFWTMDPFESEPHIVSLLHNYGYASNF